MKKITLLALLLGFSSFIEAQCLTATLGQYPDPADPNFVVPFVPTCDGFTQNNIVTDGYAGEFSSVAVTSGETYTFGSSITTDLITISADGGATAATFGIGSVTWTATITGEVWFYTHLNNGDCTANEAAGRKRYVICGTPPNCFPPVTGLTLSNLTNASVTIAWTASTSAPTNGYDYYYSTSSTAPTGVTTPSGSVAVGITTVNLSSLTDYSTYTVWIRSKCNVASISTWSNMGTFKTLCAPVTTFSQNFDAATTLPDCWAKIGTGGGTTTILTPAQSIIAFSDPNVLFIYGNTDPTAIVTGKGLIAMPPVSNAGAGTHRLSFKAKSNFTVGGQLEVGYLINYSNPNSFVSLQTFTPTSTTDYDSFTATLGTAPGSNKVLAFRHTGNPAYSILIDDVTWDAIPSCVEPTALTYASSTLTGATISWTASTPAPANGYEYYISATYTPPTNTTIPTGTTLAGVTSAVVTGYNSSTRYYFWVRSVCGATSTSDWSSSGKFNTQCAIFTVPYTLDFESAEEPQLPICTSQENVGTGNNWTVSNNPSPANGFNSKTLQYSYSSTNAADTWFYTSAVSLSAGTNYTLSYRYGNRGQNFNEKLRVGYGDSNSVSAMNIIADYPNITAYASLQDNVSFSPPVNGDYYFGFNAYSAANNFLLLVDDISVTVSLATPSFNDAKFKITPNPVKDIVTISYSKSISSVAVYNILGQQVSVKAINVDLSQLDMSNLTKGTYIIKVTADDFTQNIKVIKD